MLIVGREIGQSVIIGDVIKVTVLQMGSKLRLAIDAPKHLRVTQVKQNEGSLTKLNRGARIIHPTTIIGDFIKVTILQTNSGLLRFAIDAPKEITIFREELYKGKRLSTDQNVFRF
ncbi:carbon storage regulator [Neobacillus sp. NPDC097160]|uniref:carbon storage regulator n=1 Tax=Neobacillus sp. NPDC097160 TaxID=3364298 RepID=UPI0037FDA8AB